MSNMTKQKKLTEYLSSVTIATTISRILGYIRDMLVAQIFGAGMFADAFYAAYRIPNLFRRLLGEGSVSASFVPVFSEYVETKSKEETRELLNVVFSALLTVLFIITILGIIFAGPLTKLIAWGFQSSPEKIESAITLTRIMFPFLFFVCLAALMLGVLNSLKTFFLPAVAPASLSIAEILYVIVFIYLFTLPADIQIKGLAISVVIGGFGQYFIQKIAVLNKGFPIRLQFNLNHPGLKKILFLMIPAMIGFSVDQVNAFVDTICASFLREGAITALYYSNRLMQLPLALFGIAMATVALPTMSRSVAKNDIDEMKNTLNFSMRMVCFTLIPATAGLIVIGLPIIRLLFEHGRWTLDASSITFSALVFYSTGLLAFSVVKILASAFYSFRETKVPVRVACLCMLVNIVLNIILMRPLGVGGLALATSIASWLNASILFYFLRKKIGKIGGKKILNTLIKVCIATAGMSIAAYILSFFPHRIFIIIVTIPAALMVYFYISKLLKIEEQKLILELLTKKNLPADE